MSIGILIFYLEVAHPTETGVIFVLVLRKAYSIVWAD